MEWYIGMMDLFTLFIIANSVDVLHFRITGHLMDVIRNMPTNEQHVTAMASNIPCRSEYKLHVTAIASNIPRRSEYKLHVTAMVSNIQGHSEYKLHVTALVSNIPCDVNTSYMLLP